MISNLIPPASRGVRGRLLMGAAGFVLCLGGLSVADSAAAQSTCLKPDFGVDEDADEVVDESDAYGNQTACGAAADTTGSDRGTAIGAYADARFGRGNTAVGTSAAAYGGNDGSAEAGANAAFGYNSNAIGYNSSNVAVGATSRSTGNESSNIAIGRDADASGDNSSKVAIGTDTQATGNNAVAMGYNARALANFSVAVGAGSTANEEFTFAVGSVANRRRIVNVASGNLVDGSTDAVNGGQLFATEQRVTNIENAVANGVTRAEMQAADTVVLNSARTYTNQRETVIRNDMAAGDAATLVAANDYTDQRETEIRNDMAEGDAETLAAANTYTDEREVAIRTDMEARDDSIGESVASALGGGATYDAANAMITAPSYGIGGVFYNNVGAAFEAINTTGTNHFRTDGSLGMAQATGVGSTAMGGESVASGSRSTAAGAGAQATGVSSVALGDTARATADGAVAVGLNSAASGVNAIAIGAGATATGSVAVGAGASAANGGAAFGDGAVATGLNATATGPNARALADNSVAIGSGSIADQAGTVSMGAAGAERRVTNVAAGTAPTDAANVGQLGAAGASVAAALGGGATANATGQVTLPRYDLAMGSYDNVGGALDGLSNFALESRREARRGIAAAIAMSPAPMPSQPGRTSYTFNVSEFNGASALGGSIAHRFNTRKPFALTAGYSVGGSENAFRVGVTGEF